MLRLIDETRPRRWRWRDASAMVLLLGLVLCAVLPVFSFVSTDRVNQSHGDRSAVVPSVQARSPTVSTAPTNQESMSGGRETSQALARPADEVRLTVSGCHIPEGALPARAVALPIADDGTVMPSLPLIVSPSLGGLDVLGATDMQPGTPWLLESLDGGAAFQADIAVDGSCRVQRLDAATPLHGFVLDSQGRGIDGAFVVGCRSATKSDHGRFTLTPHETGYCVLRAYCATDPPTVGAATSAAAATELRLDLPTLPSADAERMDAHYQKLDADRAVWESRLATDEDTEDQELDEQMVANIGQSLDELEAVMLDARVGGCAVVPLDDNNGGDGPSSRTPSP